MTKTTDTKKLIESMAEAGIAYGHRTSRLHPKMKPYIESSKAGVHLIDLTKSAEKLQEALDFLANIKKEGKQVLFVGTKVQIKSSVKQVAEECNMPYVTERWLGGTLTNFKVISRRVKYLIEKEEKKSKGEFDHYTKKERLEIDREITKLKKSFEGLKPMKGLPAAIFIFDLDANDLAAREALRQEIKSIALVDTNLNPENIDYPIPANDDALSSVSFILEEVKKVLK
jgi:small subunit ribosomal protein S2